MYGEDVDLCYRIKQQGYKVIFTPDMQVIHSKGGSSDDGFKSSIIGEYKGLITFYRSYYPNRLDFLKFLLFAGALFRMIAFGIIKPERAKVYRQALKVL